MEDNHFTNVMINFSIQKQNEDIFHRKLDTCLHVVYNVFLLIYES